MELIRKQKCNYFGIQMERNGKAVTERYSTKKGPIHLYATFIYSLHQVVLIQHRF